MKPLGFAMALILVYCLRTATPADYKGTPFKDPEHKSGPQVIPGRLQCALYDLGGEGVAYHDTDAINHGSGELNHRPEHCEPGVPASICYFRENEGADISYTKNLADFNHPNFFVPLKMQLYLGWEADGEWTNYTVDVKKAGTYQIVALYSKASSTVKFSVNHKPAGECKLKPRRVVLPLDWCTLNGNLLTFVPRHRQWLRARAGGIRSGRDCHPYG